MESIGYGIFVESIGYWIIVGLVIAPVFAIALVKPDRRINRGSLGIWTAFAIAMLVILISLGHLADDYVDDEPRSIQRIAGFLAIAALGVTYLVFRIFFVARLAVRLQMFGWNKWWALLAFVGVLDAMLGVLLSALPTPEEKAAAV